MDIKRYLERIKYKGPIENNYQSLEKLKLAHLLSVPFENLDIDAKKPIILEEKSLFEKIVLKRRGGFCYELNYLFSRLLEALGFKVSILGAGVALTQEEFAPDFDHMCLMVSLEDKFLIDVGFGDCFRKPLLIDERKIQEDDFASYLIEEEGAYLLLKESKEEESWETQYRFKLSASGIEDFKESCLYHQSSEKSFFTQTRICSLAREDGRITLEGKRLIRSYKDKRWEKAINSEDEYKKVLKEEFDIVL